MEPHVSFYDHSEKRMASQTSTIAGCCVSLVGQMTSIKLVLRGECNVPIKMLLICIEVRTKMHLLCTWNLCVRCCRTEGFVYRTVIVITRYSCSIMIAYTSSNTVKHLAFVRSSMWQQLMQSDGV